MDELEATSIWIVEVEPFRDRGVLDRAADLAAQRRSPPEHLVKTRGVNVEGDLVRILRGSACFRGEEDEEDLADPDRIVLPFKLIGACELEVEAAEPIRIRCSEGEMIHAEYAHLGEL